MAHGESSEPSTDRLSERRPWGLVAPTVLFVFTTFAVGSLSLWLVPPYWGFIAWLVVPAERLRRLRARPAAPEALAGSGPAPPEPEPSVQSAGNADSASIAPEEPKPRRKRKPKGEGTPRPRRKARVDAPTEAAATPVIATWVKVGPNQYVRVEVPATDAPAPTEDAPGGDGAAGETAERLDTLTDGWLDGPAGLFGGAADDRLTDSADSPPIAEWTHESAAIGFDDTSLEGPEDSVCDAGMAEVIRTSEPFVEALPAPTGAWAEEPPALAQGREADSEVVAYGPECRAEVIEDVELHPVLEAGESPAGSAGHDELAGGDEPASACADRVESARSDDEQTGVDVGDASGRDEAGTAAEPKIRRVFRRVDRVARHHEAGRRPHVGPRGEGRTRTDARTAIGRTRRHRPW